MENYALIYNFSDKKSEKKFQQQLEEKFPTNRSVIENRIKYFSFAGDELQSVHDSFKEIMDLLKLADSDFIALYYTSQENPNEVIRLMVFGTSNDIENYLDKTSDTIHERVLADLFEFDFKI